MTIFSYKFSDFLEMFPLYSTDCAVRQAFNFPSMAVVFSWNVITIFGLFHIRSTKNSWFEIVKYLKKKYGRNVSNMYHSYYKSKFRMVFLSSSSSPWNNISHENVHIITY